MCMWYSLPSSLGYRLVAVSSTLNLLWGVQWLALARRAGAERACAYALRPPCQCRKPTARKALTLGTFAENVIHALFWTLEASQVALHAVTLRQISNIYYRDHACTALRSLLTAQYRLCHA
jgi:hypothetical protein